MKDFNIAKYLKEHNLGPHGILNHYIDLQPLKEDKKEEDEKDDKGSFLPSPEEFQDYLDSLKEDDDLGQQEAMPEPYEGPEDPIDGLGGDLDRDMDVSMNEEDEVDDTRIMDLGGDQIEQGIISLLSDGFDAQDIMNLVKYIIDTHLGAKAMDKRF